MLLDENLKPLYSSKVSTSELQVFVDTTEPMRLSFNVGAYTAGSSNTDYLPINVKICGLEKVKLKKGSLSRSYSKNSRDEMISFEELLKFFDLDDSECPIKSIELVSDTRTQESFNN